MENNRIVAEIQALAQLGFTGRQKAFHEQMAKDVKPVQCVPLKDVFTADEIRLIKKIAKPKRNQCYRNAAVLTGLFPSKVKYVEGYAYVPELIPIEHAFNKVGDKYIDVTFELALHYDVTKEEYATLIEADEKELLECLNDSGSDACYYVWHFERTYCNREMAEKFDEQALRVLEKSDGKIAAALKKAGTL